MNKVLHGLSIQERQSIHDKTERLTTHLLDYFGCYDVFDPVRFSPTAMSTVVENPELPIGMMKDIAMVTVWIFAIDDLIDEKLIDRDALRLRLAHYEDIVCGRTTEADAKDPYGYVLLDIKRTVESKPLFPLLKEMWEQSYQRMIQGMLFETDEHKDEVSSLDDYIEYSLYSVGVPLYVISSWILQSTICAIDDQDALVHMMKLSAMSLRLANDLRTYEKERREDNLNALFIKEKEWIRLGYELPAATQMAFEFVKSKMEEYMTEFNLLCDDAAPLKRALRRLTEFSISFYEEHDFHTVSTQSIQNI